MSLTLYRGLWPQNVSKLAKYAVKFTAGEWKVTVLFDVGDGMQYLAVHGGDSDLAGRVNEVKTALAASPGGTFYINEFRHVLVPTLANGSSEYYCAGRLKQDLEFEFEGKLLTTRPVNSLGQPLCAGEKWVGPRPGVPYVLAAGGADIYYQTQALTDTTPPAVRANTTRKVQLSKILKNPAALARAVGPVSKIRGYQGGRFYVNEHRAIFTPVSAGDGNGLEYVYCGQLEASAWFPEPKIDWLSIFKPTATESKV